MAKFYGEIGFAIQEETSPGVWVNVIRPSNYYGDVITNSRRLQNSNQLNDNIVISNEISIIADPYANENFHSILYVKFMGTKWKVSNVTVQYPRLILTLGEVYNG
jgi:hypothetical protein